jgi:malonyl CoA-acyl carrier protein transacylase
MTTVVLFPGQGVQRPGMGAAALGAFPDLVADASEILGYDLAELCRGADNRLARTRYAQPAVYVINALSYRMSGKTADVALGHSLGEYNALEAAGALRFLDGLRLVAERARITAGVDGAMTVVQGLREGEIRSLVTRHRLDVELANRNTPVQTVLAGPVAAIAEAERRLLAAGAPDVRRLKVDGAFHCSRMAPAAAAFAPAVANTPFDTPRISVVANRTARPYDGPEIPESLVAHLTHPVRWHESIAWVLAHRSDVRFHQPGESQVLMRMLRQIAGADR